MNFPQSCHSRHRKRRLMSFLCHYVDRQLKIFDNESWTALVLHLLSYQIYILMSCSRIIVSIMSKFSLNRSQLNNHFPFQSRQSKSSVCIPVSLRWIEATVELCHVKISSVSPSSPSILCATESCIHSSRTPTMIASISGNSCRFWLASGPSRQERKTSWTTGRKNFDVSCAKFADRTKKLNLNIYSCI